MPTRSASQKTIKLADNNDLDLIVGKTTFQVRRSDVAAASPMLKSMLESGFAEAHNSSISFGAGYDDTAMEMIIRAIYGASLANLLKLYKPSLRFLEHLGAACDFYDCGHLVPTEYKKGLKLPDSADKSQNDNIDFLSSFIAAYQLGWKDEVTLLLPHVIKFLSFSSNKRWIYKGVHVDGRGMPLPLFNALIAARKWVLEQFLYKHKQEYCSRSNRADGQEDCKAHGLPCAKTKFGIFHSASKAAEIINVECTDSKDFYKDHSAIKCSLASLLSSFEATADKHYSELDNKRCNLPHWHRINLEDLLSKARLPQ